MKINVLVEEHGNKDLRGEHGLSLFLEIDELNILFDTGQSALYLENAVKMGIDIHKAHMIVLSHGHYDHGNGLVYMINKELVCHIGCFVERFRKSDNTFIGMPFSLQEAQKRFTLRMSDSPLLLHDNVYFLGGIPRVLDFEAPDLFTYVKGGEDDYILDDSAIVVKSDKGNIIITGCSHSGICNIVEHAIAVTGDVRTYAIFGGLHLKEIDERLMETIAYMHDIGVQYLYPVHCTSEKVVEEMKNQLPNTVVSGVATGMQIVI